MNELDRIEERLRTFAYGKLGPLAIADFRSLLKVARAADEAALNYGRTYGPVVLSMERLANALATLTQEDE
mgnify:CR=1 FL=1